MCCAGLQHSIHPARQEPALSLSHLQKQGSSAPLPAIAGTCGGRVMNHFVINPVLHAAALISECRDDIREARELAKFRIRIAATDQDALYWQAVTDAIPSSEVECLPN